MTPLSARTTSRLCCCRHSSSAASAGCRAEPKRRNRSSSRPFWPMPLLVPQMLVDSDGTLHFGPRTVPPAALESAEARRSYTRQMLQRAQTSAARGGLASARILEGHTPPAAGRKQGSRSEDLPGGWMRAEDRGCRRHHLLAQRDSSEEPQQSADGIRDGCRGHRSRELGPLEGDQSQLSRRRAVDRRQ